MDFLGIILLIIWLVAGGLGAADKRRKRQAGLPKQTARARPPTPRRAEGKPPSVLDRLREELERMQEQARAAERPPIPSTPPETRRVYRPAGAEEVEERESLEVEPEIWSLEVPAPIWERAPVAQDDLAEAIVQRRRQEADARNRALTLADHRAFDKAIRTPRQAAAAPPVRRRGALRDAMVWREILGPPKGML